MFGNVQEIIDFHKKYFTPTLRKADGNSEKLLYLLKHRNREMKGLYGKFCINKTKSTYIISQHRDFMEQLRTFAQSKYGLSDLLDLIVLRTTQYKMLFDEVARLSRAAEQEQEFAVFSECSGLAHELAKVADTMMTAGNIEDFAKVGKGKGLNETNFQNT